MNYQNGKIYVIKNYVNPLVYVGSTTQALSQRMVKHRANVKIEINKSTKLYQAFDKIGIDKFYVELVKDYPCKSKEQLMREGGYFIRAFDSFNNGFNAKIEGRTRNEYIEDNKDNKIEYSKKYYEINKQVLIEKANKYYNDNKQDTADQGKNKIHV